LFMVPLLPLRSLIGYNDVPPRDEPKKSTVPAKYETMPNGLWTSGL
jgi:hypothetical protein